MSLAMQGTGCVTPGYSYNYPSRSMRLTGVKKGIFNPRLPTIRQMDRDSNMQLLPDEHCRTTTTLGPEDFKRSTSTLLQPGKIKLHHLPITAQGKQLLEYGPDLNRGLSASALERTKEEWRHSIIRTPSKFSAEMREGVHLPEGPTFTGYALRYLRPEITSSWQYTLQQQPTLDQYAGRPLPTNIFARYRDTHPQYNRDASSQVWR